ncbi:Conserved_hypothetical protein [Hexamita inflata]|uniref:Uncharacterized protein n=1 Tax=Hexamita inflata TaxID=28002 RepID=A0AA86UMS8_9EUKA|nr:Conserved hypothetical protein [Hexamita inflata]
MDIQDLLHLLKRIHYRHVKKPIKLQFKLDGLEYDFRNLSELFDIDPRCFQDKPNLKMIDSLAQQFYSIKNIKVLLNSSERNPALFLVMIYFVLIYPLATLFVKVDALSFQKMVALSLVTWLRLVSLSSNVRAENVWSDDAMNLGENNGKNISHLTISDQIWMKETIVTLAQILKIVANHNTVYLVAATSYLCESYFSVLRYLSHNDNSAQKAEQIVINKEVLDYCCFECQQEIRGNKESRSKTLVIKKDRILNSEELLQIDQVSWAMIRMIDDESCTDIEIRKYDVRQLQTLITNYIKDVYTQNNIVENFWSSNEEMIQYDENNKNGTCQGRNNMVMANSDKKQTE